MREIRSTN